MIIRSIYLTKKCNMRCLICYEKDKTTEFSFNDISILIDDFYKTDKELIANNEKVMFEFLGGEPFLAFPLMLETINYVECIYGRDNVIFTITSNGSVITTDIVTFLKKANNVRLSISFEGINFSQVMRLMVNGENSFPVVEANILRLNDEGIRFKIHPVITPYNVHLLKRSLITMIDKYNISSFELGIVENTVEVDKEFINRFYKEMDDFSRYILMNNVIVDMNLFRGFVKTQKQYLEKNGSIIGEIYTEGEKVEYTSEIYSQWKGSGQGYIEGLRKAVFCRHCINTAMYANGISNRSLK